MVLTSIINNAGQVPNSYSPSEVGFRVGISVAYSGLSVPGIFFKRASFSGQIPGKTVS
jgi:hypothetical protein